MTGPGTVSLRCCYRVSAVSPPAVPDFPETTFPEMTFRLVGIPALVVLAGSSDFRGPRIIAMVT